MQNIFTKISLEFNLDAIRCKLVLHYEAQTFLGLGVSRRRTRINVRHRHETDTYDYTELGWRVSVHVVSGVRICASLVLN